jgi:adenylate cyclase
MVELHAQGPESDQNWTQPINGPLLKLGRKTPESDWACPWDTRISRFHATLTWQGGKLRVQRNPSALNPIYLQGQAKDDFEVGVGEQFVIGGTTFTLQEMTPEMTVPEAAPNIGELTCSRDELQALPYTDAEHRIKVLASLPAMIRESSSEEQLETQVLQALLQCIPRADIAAVVWLDPACSPDAPDIRVRTVIDRTPATPALQPSRKLVVDAVRRRRQTVMHRWGTGGDSGFKTVGVGNWAVCAPLPDEVSPGFALYLTGRSLGDLLAAASGRSAPDDHFKSDLKFAELVADIFGALRQIRDLQSRQMVLTQFVSPMVRQAFSREDITKVLTPRETDVTVVFCDLRGSCKFTEEGASDLAVSHDRIGAALTVMTTNIIDMDGVIGDFQGDASMAFWGWPFESPDQVEQACRAALTIARDLQRASKTPDHKLQGFACGIGIASGTAIAGRMGTADQLKVGVFGPVVNLAARLESMTKLFKVPILLDDRAAAQIRQRGSRRCRIRQVAKVRPYGMNQALLISELLPPATEVGAMSDSDVRNYEAALDAFRSGRWSDTPALLSRLKNDGPSEVLRQFMARHANVPPAQWDGVIQLESK